MVNELHIRRTPSECHTFSTLESEVTLRGIIAQVTPPDYQLVVCPTLAQEPMRAHSHLLQGRVAEVTQVETLMHSFRPTLSVSSQL